MGSGRQRIDKIADITFSGRKVAASVAEYARQNQQLAHDMARELDAAASGAEAAMLELDGHPLLMGVDVRIRAWRVSRVLRDSRELAVAIGAEMVKFNIQFREEFITTAARSTKKNSYKGQVTL